MSGVAPVTTTPTPIVDAYHKKTYAYATVAGMSVVEYIGLASPNTLKSGTGWIIKKFYYDTDGTVLDEVFADSNDFPDKIWNNYLTYTYTQS